jgi:hypothetical protein
MFQLAFGGGQSLADLSQAVGSPQLTEQHGHELAPAGKPASMDLAAMFANRRFNLYSCKQLQQLSENAAYSIHGGSLASDDLVLPRTHFNLSRASTSFLDCHA